jgi:preprotein translocase subunit SecD
MDGNRIELVPTKDGNARALKDAMTTARDVVRRRIDPQGTKEITVINQGPRRILVQVPGVEDPEALKALIGQTARLDSSWSTLRPIPSWSRRAARRLAAQVLPMVEGGGAIAVKRRVLVDGDQLTDARQIFDENGAPAISFNFNNTGAKRFARVTQENIGKPFAIILDNRVLSAPNIQTPILGGVGPDHR